MKGAWLKMADESINAALDVAERCPRACSSRAYYAAYSAAQAALLHCGETPLSRGNWPHDGLGLAVSSTLGRRKSRHGRQSALAVKDDIDWCYSNRIAADYGPTRLIGSDEAKEAIKRARRVVHTIEELIQ